MPESTVFAHRVAIDFSLVREVFLLVANPWAGDPCPSFVRLNSPHSPWPSVCFINVERGRFCCLDRMTVCIVSGTDNGVLS